MKINNKIYFKSLNHGVKGSYILINKFKNQILMEDKEEIKKDLWKEISNKYEDTGKIDKEFKERLKTLFYDIESVFVEYNPFGEEGLYKVKDVLYYNLFENSEIRKKMLNTYKEFKKQNKLYTDLKFLKKYKYVNYLFNSLTNNDNQTKQYLINWLSYIFITHKKTMNTIIIKGVEGTGKGLLFDFIINKVFLDNQTTTISNNELNNNFNEFLENKSFIVANEVQDYTNKTSTYEKLKQWITDTNILLNAKHEKHRNIVNFSNFLIYSNNDKPIPITITDRRYSVIETTNKQLKDTVIEDFNITITEYVKELQNEVENFLLDLSKYDFDETEALKLLNNNDRNKIILQTEDKTKILKNKIIKTDKNWFLKEYVDEYFFHYELEDYIEILNYLKLKNDNETIIDIEIKHEQIIDEIFEVLKERGIIPNPYLKYLLFFMYSFILEENMKETNNKLNKYVSKLGEKSKPFSFKNKTFKGIVFNINTDKIITKNIKELQKDEILQLKKRIAELEEENKMLKQQLEIPF